MKTKFREFPTVGKISAVVAAVLLGPRLIQYALNKSRELQLRGKVAVVTGGSRGLGFLIARELLRNGCRVAICARSADELSRAKQMLEKFGTEIIDEQTFTKMIAY